MANPNDQITISCLTKCVDSCIEPPVASKMKIKTGAEKTTKIDTKVIDSSRTNIEIGGILSIKKDNPENIYTIEVMKDGFDWAEHFFPIIPSILWWLLTAILLFCLRKELKRLINVLIEKISKIKRAKWKEYEVEATEDAVDTENLSHISIDDESYYWPKKEEMLKDSMARKILFTLWTYQKKYGKDDQNKTKWCFYINDNSEFDNKINRLQYNGLVIFIQSKQMWALSNIGILFCKKYEKNLGSDKFIFE